jgi:CPA2 family monovalent cation:H+ antiporter-2
VVTALGTAAAIIALVVVFARRILPPVLERVAMTCSPELFLLSVIAICIGTAYGTSLAGVSVSLGAFLAGLVVSESRFNSQALSEVLPLQIVFSATFFVSIGMLLDLGFLVEHLPMVLGAVLALFVVKAVTAGLAVRALGVPMAVAAATALTLAQVGEFSFVLAASGAAEGLTPAGLGEDGTQAFIAATGAPHGLHPRADGRRGAARRADDAGDTGPELPGRLEPEAGAAVAEGVEDHVVVAGYGRWGRGVTRVLAEAGVPQVVATLSPTARWTRMTRAFRCCSGIPARTRTLLEAGVGPRPRGGDPRRRRRARRAGHPRRADRAARRDDHRPHPLRRGRRGPRGRRRGLRRHGGDRGERDARHEGPQDVRRRPDRGGHPGPRRARLLPRPARRAARAPPQPAVVDTQAAVRVELAPGACPHAARSTGAVVPLTSGCEECLERGDSWVHLRLCLSCGHVGCCDSSPNRHARHHHEDSGHHVVRSAEPGESWVYCLADERALEVRPAGTDAASTVPAGASG